MATKTNVDTLSTIPADVLRAINTVGASVATLEGAYTVIRKAYHAERITVADGRLLIGMALKAHMPSKYGRQIDKEGIVRGSALERKVYRLWGEMLGVVIPQGDKKTTRVPSECMTAITKLLATYSGKQIREALKRAEAAAK